MSSEPSYRYSAFFSYSRADDRVARPLFYRLDKFRTPKDLIGSNGRFGPVPAKLHPIFRDREDLSGGGVLDQRLDIALRDSRTLIVLCSPSSAKSVWVNHEVETFKTLGRTEHIFPVIVSGEPGAVSPDMECFPPALRDTQLLAADLREIRRADGVTIGDGVESGTLKLIAGLLGVEFDQLRRRELRRLRIAAMRNAAIAAGALVLTGISIVAGLGAFASALTAEIRSNSAFAAESKFLAERASSGLADGNEIAALRDTRAGLPRSIASPDRPFFLNSETALRGVLTQMRAYAQLPHDKPVAASVFLSADRWLVTVERMGHVRLWRMTDAVLMRTWEQVETGDNSALVALSDGKFAVSVRDGRIAILDAADDTVRLVGTEGQIVSALKAAGKVLLALRSDGELVAIDWQRNAVLSKVEGVEPLFSPLALSSDGGTAVFVSSGDGDKVIVRVAPTSALAGGQAIPAGSRVFSLALSPDEKSLAIGDGLSILLSDVDGQNPRKLSGHRGFVMSVVFSSDGRSIVSAGADGLGKVWSVADNEAHADLVGHEGLVNRVLLSDDKLAITYGGDLTVRLWALNGTPRPTPIVLRGHRSRINNLAASGDHRWIATSSEDATVVVWSKGSPISEVVSPPLEMSHLFAWSRHFDWVLGVDGANVVQWQSMGAASATGPKIAVSLPASPTTGQASRTAWSGGGAIGRGGKVALTHNGVFYLGTAGSDMRAVSFPGRTVSNYALSREVPAVVVVLDDGKALLSEQGSDEWITLGDLVRFAALSEDGAFVVLGRDTGVSVVDGPTRQTLQELPLTDAERVTFSEKGTVAIVSSASQSLLVDLTQKTAPVTITARSGSAVTLSSSGRRAAGAAPDGTIWFWTSGSGVVTGKVEARRPAASILAVDDDSELAAAGYGDGFIRLWDMRTARNVARLETFDDDIVELRFETGRTLQVLTDDGQLTRFNLPPYCDDLLALADTNLSRMQERSALDTHTASVPGFWNQFYLDRVRPAILPLAPVVGDTCGATASSGGKS